MADYTIASASEHDLLALAEVETMALLPSPFNSIYFRRWADIPTQIYSFHLDLQSLAKAPNTKILKATSHTTGQIDGYVCWTDYLEGARPIAPTEPTTAQPPVHEPTAAELRLPLRIEVIKPWRTAALRLKHDLTSTGGLHTYISKLYVRPSTQRRGIATRLWEAGPGSAAHAHRHVSLISMGASQGFYAKLGFARCAFFDVDLSAHAPAGAGFGIFRFQGMVREGKMGDGVGAVEDAGTLAES